MTSVPRYASGEDVLVGDRVRCAGAMGTVMFVVERDQWSEEFPGDQWRYLERGFMVKEDDGTLIHYDQPDSCTELVSRAGNGDAA